MPRVGKIALVAFVLALMGGCGGTSRTARASATHSRPPRHATRTLGARRSAARPAARIAQSRTLRRLLGLGLPIYCAGHRGREIALTFDDGPGPYTHLALRKLARARERATFFVVARSMGFYPGYLRRELRVAALGDHTYTHPVLTALSSSQITWQLRATARKIEAQTRTRVKLFRPPYGVHNAIVDRIAHRLGLLEILWDVDSADSLGANYVQIIRNVEAHLHPGAIILMHENRGQTIRALTTLFPVLHRRHLRSVSVLELLASDPPSLSQVRRGFKGCGAAGKVHARGRE